MAGPDVAELKRLADWIGGLNGFAGPNSDYAKAAEALRAAAREVPGEEADWKSRALAAEAALRSMNGVSLHQTDRPAREWTPGMRFRGHPLTCGNDSNHAPLYPWCDDGVVKLICRDCDYTQSNAAMFTAR